MNSARTKIKNSAAQNLQKKPKPSTHNPTDFLQIFNEQELQEPKNSSQLFSSSPRFLLQEHNQIQLSICNLRLSYGWEFKVACGKMALCTKLYPNKIFFGGFNGGYGKMWVYNLRSEFLKHKITIY